MLHQDQLKTFRKSSPSGFDRLKGAQRPLTFMRLLIIRVWSNLVTQQSQAKTKLLFKHPQNSKKKKTNLLCRPSYLFIVQGTYLFFKQVITNNNRIQNKIEKPLKVEVKLLNSILRSQSSILFYTIHSYSVLQIIYHILLNCALDYIPYALTLCSRLCTIYSYVVL